jgi:hypothetical protein
MPYFARAVFIVCTLAASSCVPPPTQADTLLGVNDVHLGWLKPAQRDSVIDEMAKAGVISVRVGLVPPFDDTLDALAKLNRRGISVALVVSLGRAEMLGRDAKVRAGRGKIWSVPGLSQIEPEYFRQKFEEIWQEIERRGIHLVAIELGNEINWAAFNGDLAVKPPSMDPPPGAPGISGLTNTAAFEKGLEQYIHALEVVKEIRDASTQNRHAALLSAGLAYMPATFADSLGGEYVDAIQTLAFLKSMGLDSLVDGYAIHFYPDRTAGPIQREKTFEGLLRLCGEKNGRTCWLTEWGVAQPDTDCGANETQRIALILEIRRSIAKHAAQGRLSGAYYFDWDGTEEPYSIWRCGQLTESGKTLLRH